MQTISVGIPEQHAVGYKCIHKFSKFFPHLQIAGVWPICNTTLNSHDYANTISYSRRNSDSMRNWLHSKFLKSSMPTTRSEQSYAIDPQPFITTDTLSVGLPSKTQDLLAYKNSAATKASDSSQDKDSQCTQLSLPMILQDPFISIDDMYARMICLDQYFLQHQDYMLHFNNIYLEMTRLVRAKIATGTYFELSEWMKNYTAHFGNFYRQALLNFQTGNIDNVPRSWRLAFEHAYKGDMIIFINFALGMNAHIVHDLGIALSELDITGVNATAKKSDSDKVNAIIHNCSLALWTVLIDFYAPVINMTNWESLLHVALDAVTDVLRADAWKDAMFITAHPAAKDAKGHLMDADASLLEEAVVAISPLFTTLKEYERSLPFDRFCTIVPWGCAKQ